MKNLFFGLFITVSSTLVLSAQTDVIIRPITIKVSHVVNEIAPKALASNEFKRLMEQKFPGRVKVEVFHDNSLFKDREETEALDLGAINVIVPTAGKVATFYGVKEFELFDLPFLFNTSDDILKFTKSSAGDKLLNFMNLKSKNTLAVTYWANDFQNFFGVKAFKKPSDFTGLTAGVTSAGTKEIFLKSLGAKETLVLPFSQIPMALKKEGEFKIDVSANANSNFYTAKIYQSTKHLTLSKHDVNLYVFLTNRRWFNNLPEDIKIGFLESAKEAGIYHFDIAQKAGIADIEKSKKEGVEVHTLTDAERNQFKQKALTSHENYLKNINKDFLNEVYKLVNTK